jgi:hypothetical protein
MATFTSATMGLGVNAEQAKAFDALGLQYAQSFTAMLSDSIQSNVTAVGTTLSASTTQLLYDICLIGSASKNSNDTVQLRTFTSGLSRRQVVINRSGALVQVFAPTGGFIIGSGTSALFATDAAYSLANNQVAEFHAVATNQYMPARHSL